MIKPSRFYSSLISHGVRFFTGVPDSLLKDFCAYVTDHVEAKDHVINANEGGALALAAGYHLATGEIPLVYLQNSGLGNLVNPLLSLVAPEVYNIPALIIIGWRGEPGVHDEPQHIKQGRVMISMLESMEIPFTVIGPNTQDFDVKISIAVEQIKTNGIPHALLIRKNTFESCALKSKTKTNFPLSREAAIGIILQSLNKNDLVVSSTGMISREVFELRESLSMGHQNDFMTVGSMGHCSQIALGISQRRPNNQIYCLDGDGSVIMHLGSLAIIGSSNAVNFKHIVLNNGAHDSVGGQPTVGFNIDICQLAKSCGYRSVMAALTPEDVKDAVLEIHGNRGPVLLEIKINKGARKNLIRPSTTPVENKRSFMKFVSEL